MDLQLKKYKKNEIIKFMLFKPRKGDIYGFTIKKIQEK